ncbi:rod shape-determining protein [Pseudomonadota bacterium]
MSNLFKKLFIHATVYIRIKKNRLSVRNISTGELYEDVPFVAIMNEDNGKYVLSYGTKAKNEPQQSGNRIDIINPFDHPRTIIANFDIARYAFRFFLKHILHNKLLRPRLIMIIHVTEELEGGLTQLEIRAIQELAISEGGQAVHIWNGRELMDNEIKENKYPGDHWLTSPPR